MFFSTLSDRHTEPKLNLVAAAGLTVGTSELKNWSYNLSRSSGSFKTTEEFTLASLLKPVKYYQASAREHQIYCKMKEKSISAKFQENSNYFIHKSISQ